MANAAELSPTIARKAHNVVFELTSSDPKAWVKLMNNVENLIKALGPDIQVEIVAHGDGLKMLLLSSADRPEARMEALSKGGVVFAACQNTMRGMNVEPKDLVPFAKPVDSGVAEVVRRQQDGWSYLSR
ncbi:DsrE family protein [Asticcacaulis sp. EMRT-3]|uniref:DsrE family protein n=1 Tax=Asticcacaulis sp. EMRT-3 TaxID=3040349 RepID=UPI0024AF4E49|nr:DsrE family protein [Asticcacaulis sp. EMRT-3]MDI7776684.1 DsrE family protein [Asticcacaulis sp. EMRT-3]